MQGGMSYNKQTGFLQLPVDGLYFMYSQAVWEQEQIILFYFIKVRPAPSSIADPSRNN